MAYLSGLLLVCAATCTVALPTDGVYTLINMHSQKVLNVEDNSFSNGGNVWQWDSSDHSSSQWELKSIAGGSYNLLNMNSGLALNVQDNSVNNGGNIWQWQHPTYTSSQWSLQPVAEDTYAIKNVNSGKFVNVQDNSLDAGGNVWQWDDATNPASQWRFTVVPSPPPSPTPSPSGQHYSWGDAWNMAHLSAATYCGASRFNSWNVGTQKYSVDKSKVRFIENPVTHATAGVGRMSDPLGCFVAIRGTHDTVQDIVDGLFFYAPFNRTGCDGCKAHAGFLGSWDSIHGMVRRALEDFGCQDRRIYLTGHSLGAAMVHYALFDLLDAGYHFQHVTAMETPRPGNKVFATALQRKIANASVAFDAYRITHYKDIVPHVPPYGLINYIHALPQIYYGERANSNDFTNCGYADGFDVGLGHCMNMFPPLQWNMHDHCWFGNMNPCSCGSGLDGLNRNISMMI